MDGHRRRQRQGSRAGACRQSGIAPGGAMSPPIRLCLIAAAVLVLGCRGGGPEPQGGDEQAAGKPPPTAERQAPEDAPPVAAEPGTDAEPQAAEDPAVGRDQAVDVARRQVLFEPETVLAELAADEEPPVWRVTLRGRRPGGSLFAFEEATVTLDARTGDVLGVEPR